MGRREVRPAAGSVGALQGSVLALGARHAPCRDGSGSAGPAAVFRTKAAHGAVVAPCHVWTGMFPSCVPSACGTCWHPCATTDGHVSLVSANPQGDPVPPELGPLYRLSSSVPHVLL
ncbi:unnamed protein product [Coccothraustes coccothraustes]